MDFISNTQTATLNSGDNHTTIIVPVICDRLVEGVETFDITLSVQSDGSVPVELGLSRATGIITDSTGRYWCMHDRLCYLIFTCCSS